MTAPAIPFIQASVEAPEARVQGTVLVPGDAGYDDARKAWNRAYEHHPAMIVLAESTSDVAEAVQFARQHALPIAVQSTGRGVIRPADGSLLILMSRMTKVQINLDAATTWVEGGAKWWYVLPKAQEVGLAPLLGSTTDVGVVGYSLGGGFGWLGRKYGLGTDSLRSRSSTCRRCPNCRNSCAAKRLSWCAARMPARLRTGRRSFKSGWTGKRPSSTVDTKYPSPKPTSLATIRKTQPLPSPAARSCSKRATRRLTR